MLDNYQGFLDQVFSDIARTGIDVSRFELDHVAYTASSKDEYKELRRQALELGKLCGEDLVGGQRVGVIKLDNPLIYKDRRIPGFELIEPVEGLATQSRLDHIEFVVPEGNEQLMREYPQALWNVSSLKRPEYPHLKVDGLNVKFHELDIFDTIKSQHRKRAELQ